MDLISPRGAPCKTETTTTVNGRYREVDGMGTPWTGRTSGRDPQGSVLFQTRPSDRPFSSPVAVPESYVLPVPWRAAPSARFNHALLRPSSWLGRCRRLGSSSSPDRRGTQQIVGSTAGEHARRAAAPHRTHNATAADQLFACGSAVI
jgi:hypothetical protein